MSGNAIDRLVEGFRACSVAQADIDVKFKSADRPSFYVDGNPLTLVGFKGQFNDASGLTIREVTYMALDARPTTEPFNADRMKFSVASPVIERVLEPA